MKPYVARSIRFVPGHAISTRCLVCVATSTQWVMRNAVFAVLLFVGITLPVHASANAGSTADDAITGSVSVDSENIRSLLVLHTNDIHDHIRAGNNGVGGLPFVSGFVRSVRAERDDVLVMDAGDVSEKGELVARKIRGTTSSKLQRYPAEERDRHTPVIDSDITFESMARVGYDVWAPGNHDHDFGIEALYRFSELAEMDIVCINLLKEDGKTEFPPSVVYEVNGIRVGVIGAIEPRNVLSLDMEQTALTMGEEARRLKTETDIIFGLVHISVNNSIKIARKAPDIDVIISGHSHQKTSEPVVVPETGALIVQAGEYAKNVGWLELQVDITNRGIASYEYRLVEMNHQKIAPDLEMMEWVRQKEMELAPEAFRYVSWSPRTVSRIEVGILAAEALRRATNSDIALHKTAHIVRSNIPPGIHDVNAVYRTGGERGEFLVEVELTGTEINDYIQGLPFRNWLPTNWSGFYGTFDGMIFQSDLDPDRRYTVVMPEREWRQRFVRLFRRVENEPDEIPGITAIDRTLDVRDIDTKWIEAVTFLLEEFRRDNVTLLEGINRIAEATGQTDMLEMFRRYD